MKSSRLRTKGLCGVVQNVVENPVVPCFDNHKSEVLQTQELLWGFLSPDGSPSGWKIRFRKFTITLCQETTATPVLHWPPDLQSLKITY